MVVSTEVVVMVVSREVVVMVVSKGEVVDLVGFRLKSLRLRLQGLGSRIQGLVCRVYRGEDVGCARHEGVAPFAQVDLV